MGERGPGANVQTTEDMRTVVEEGGKDYRERLLDALSDAVSEEGYPAVTVADIVRRARVSKRTFYEEFDTKEDCLLALYEAQTGRLLQEVRKAMGDAPPGEPRIRAGVEAYLTSLQARPGRVRTLTLEILRLGVRGLATRRRVMRRFAELVLSDVDGRAETTEHAEAIATALVGGVNELLLQAVEEDRVDRLGELSGSVAELFRAFLPPGS